MTVRVVSAEGIGRFPGERWLAGALVTVPDADALALVRLGLAERVAGPPRGTVPVEHRDPTGRLG